MGASLSLLMATITFESFIPERCWMAPDMPTWWKNFMDHTTTYYPAYINIRIPRYKGLGPQLFLSGRLGSRSAHSPHQPQLYHRTTESLKYKMLDPRRTDLDAPTAPPNLSARVSNIAKFSPLFIPRPPMYICMYGCFNVKRAHECMMYVCTNYWRNS
jgi:hypothetical protein